MALFYAIFRDFHIQIFPDAGHIRNINLPLFLCHIGQDLIFDLLWKLRQYILFHAPQDKWPDYDYFINAQQGHYNLTLENMAAFVVKDYALDSGMDKEEWELKRICYCEDVYQVYVESKSGNELYILLSEGQGIQPDYIIMADIRKGDGADISLYEGEYSYG